MSLVHAGLTADANLQGYWKLDNSLNDSSSNAYHLTDASTSNTTDALFDQARDFESGSSQYAYRTDPANLRFTGSFTLGCFAKLESLISSNPINKDSGAASGGGYALSILNTGKLRFVFRDTGDANRVYDSTRSDIVAGPWFFLAVVLNTTAQTVTLCINNEIETVASVTTAPKTNALDFALGIRKTDLNGPYDGVLDEVFAFNRALSNAELLAIYSGMRSGRGDWFV